MKALLTSFTKTSKIKDGQLSSSTLSGKSKSGKDSKQPSFLGSLIALAEGKEKQTAAKEPSTPQDKKALLGSVAVKTDTAADKNEVKLATATISLENGKQKEMTAKRKAEKTGRPKKSKTRASKEAKKTAALATAAAKKKHGLSGGKVMAPAKESIPASKKLRALEKTQNTASQEKAAEKKITGATGEKVLKPLKETAADGNIKTPGKARIEVTRGKTGTKKIVGPSGEKASTPVKGNTSASAATVKGKTSKNKQGAVSVISKSTETKKGGILKKRTDLAKVKKTLTKVESGHKAKEFEAKGFEVGGKKEKQNRKVIQPATEETVKKKGRRGQDASTLFKDKAGKKGFKAPAAKQGKPENTLPSQSNQENKLFESIDKGKQAKMAQKERAKLKFTKQGQKQAASNLLGKKPSTLDGKGKEQLKKRMTKQAAQEEKSSHYLSKDRPSNYSGSSSSKATSSTLKPLNRKAFPLQHSADSQKNAQTVSFQNFEGWDNNISLKEVETNSLKTVQAGNSGGGRKFAKLLEQVARQQLNSKAHTARKTANWKHHRFILKDGNTLNIAARTSNGALQLQLAAGNGELRKIIQRHLLEIRQHIQQKLDIEIDLQLQDFTGQQTDQQHDSVAERNASGNTEVDEQNSTNNNLTEQAENHQIRYFGFNKNEWVA